MPAALKRTTLRAVPPLPTLTEKLERLRRLAHGETSAELHPGSLLRDRMLRMALNDPALRIAPRAVDLNWGYERFIPISPAGFNPFSSTYYFGAQSVFSRWLDDPAGPSRELNENDHLFKEVFFLAHDYLHFWSMAAVASLAPRLGIGSAPITPENFEDFVFIMMVTEAAATVGLDYWYLSTFDVNRKIDIGTLASPMTVSYREQDLAEFQKFSPKFEVQKPDFYDFIALFYCTGEFVGFDLNDLRRSPRLLAWLRHELEYGELQRKYARQWLSQLSQGRVRLKEEELTKPCVVNRPWKHRLIGDLGALLWEKIKHRKMNAFEPIPAAELKWTARETQEPDFRYLNLNKFIEENPEWTKLKLSTDSFKYFVYQYVSTFEFARCSPEARKLVSHLVQAKDLSLLRFVFQGQPKLDAQEEGPYDILIPN